MANPRKQPGLPPGFDLDIPSTIEGPVQIGDYLDEVESPPRKVRPPLPQTTTTDANVVEFPKSSKEAESQKDSKPKSEESPPALDDQKKAVRKKKPKEHKGPARKQINATPEALKMIEELLDHVQTFSVQKDAKAS